MTTVSADAIKELRERTGAGIMDCKRALEDAQGDMDKASDLLKERGIATVAKKASRAANEGLIETYVHAGGRIGVIVELNCETDFVARTEDFRELAHNIALQVAAMNPQAIDDEIPLDDLDTSSGEPRLLHQPFVKDASQTIANLLTDTVAKVGENIVIKRFARYGIGEE